MTESTAIASHLARKYNLYGQTQNEAAVIDMILSVATDLKNANIKTVWDPKFVGIHIFFGWANLLCHFCFRKRIGMNL